jgi:hypothetical protein
MEIAWKGCSHIIAQKPKHANIVVCPELEKRLDGQRPKSTIGDGLADDRPPHRQSFLNVSRVRWNELFMPTTIRPDLAQSGSRLNRQRNLGIGIRGFGRALSPLPHRPEIKPPDLPILLEGEIVQRVLAV